MPAAHPEGSSKLHPELTERQGAVLRAVVQGFIGEAVPIGSKTLTHLLVETLSPASVRNTLAELTKLGLVEKPHASAGRTPTERGLRVFVDDLLDTDALASYERRSIAYSLDEAEGDGVARIASQILSDRTRQLGFVVPPRFDRIPLRHVSLVRLSSERTLVVLVSTTGAAHRRLIDGEPDLDQPALDRIATMLNERLAGRTLREVREHLEREAKVLRDRAARLLRKVVEIGARAEGEHDENTDLVIETRLALLDQPEFHDPRRVRDLFEAIETKERLLDVLDEVISQRGVCVAFGEEIEEPALRRCALVATQYGDRDAPLGMLGVIGPSRMDYRRVIPFVEYLSEVVTEKLSA